MRFFNWFKNSEQRASVESPNVPLSAANLSWIGGDTNNAGVTVNRRTAMGVSAVRSCVTRISSDIAQLPFFVYEITADGRIKIRTHPAFKLLHQGPNDYMTSLVFRETMMANALIEGNGYAYIEKKQSKPIALWPLLPTRTKAVRDKNGELYYVTLLEDNQPQTLMPDQVLHIVGTSSADGLVGVSILEQSQNVLGVSIASDEYAAKFFANGATLSGYLKHPGKLSPEAQRNLKTSFSPYQGLNNAHGVPLLQEGLEFEPNSVEPEKAQLNDVREFQLREVCRLFNMPPHKVSDLSKATYNNIEQENISYVQSTLGRWIAAWEQECDRKLLAESEKGKFYCEMSVDAMLRGDQKTRYENYAKGLQGGWLSVNDILAWENMDKVEGGDVHLTPLNMAPTSELVVEEEEVVVEENSVDLNLIIEDAKRRLRTKERNAIKRALKKFTDDRVGYAAWLTTFYEGHRKMTKEVYQPIIQNEEELNKAVDEHIVNGYEAAKELNNIDDLQEGF